MATDINKKIIEDISKRIGKVALKTAGFIKMEMPVKTGRARNSIVIQKKDDGWIIGSNLDYIKFIETGTRPHIISPKNKQALYWPGAASPFKKVKHPGTKGKFIFLKASKFAEKAMIEEFSK